MFSAMRLTAAKNWKSPKCPSVDAEAVVRVPGHPQSALSPQINPFFPSSWSCGCTFWGCYFFLYQVGTSLMSCQLLGINPKNSHCFSSTRTTSELTPQHAGECGLPQTAYVWQMEHIILLMFMNRHMAINLETCGLLQTYLGFMRVYSRRRVRFSEREWIPSWT